MPTDKQKRDRRKLMRSRGIALLVPAAPAMERVRFLRDQCRMSYKQIAEHCHIASRTAHDMYRGYGSDTKPGVPLKARTDTIQRIMQAPIPEGPGKAWVPICGAARRIDALALRGFPMAWIERTYNTTLPEFWRQKQVAVATHERIKTIYTDLEGKHPDDYGIAKQSQRCAIGLAEKGGAAPMHCWDADTIDDPASNPEWTGQCGTLAGYRIHIREEQLFWKLEPTGRYIKVIGCSRCRQANTRDAKALHSKSKTYDETT